jgi:hypothetical protein
LYNYRTTRQCNTVQGTPQRVAAVEGRVMMGNQPK